MVWWHTPSQARENKLAKIEILKKKSVCTYDRAVDDIMSCGQEISSCTASLVTVVSARTHTPKKNNNNCAVFLESRVPSGATCRSYTRGLHDKPTLLLKHFSLMTFPDTLSKRGTSFASNSFDFFFAIPLITSTCPARHKYRRSGVITDLSLAPLPPPRPSMIVVQSNPWGYNTLAHARILPAPSLLSRQRVRESTSSTG